MVIATVENEPHIYSALSRNQYKLQCEWVCVCVSCISQQIKHTIFL